MRHFFCEYRKVVEITGYKNVSFTKAEEFLKSNRKETEQTINIQFFDAELIATWEHLYFAVLNALQAFQNKTNISKSSAMETMLYASAQRQILKAIKLVGIKPETTSIAVIIICESPAQLENMLQKLTKFFGKKPQDEVLEMSKVKEKKIIEAFKITNEEIKTIMKNDNRQVPVVDLIIEQVAVLATQL